MEERALRMWDYLLAENEATEGRPFKGMCGIPRPRDGGALLADSIEGQFGADDGRLLRLTQYELKLDAALRAAVRELRNMQRDGSFSDEEEEVPAVEEKAGGENEPNEEAEPDAGRAAPAAAAVEKAADQGGAGKTNPTPEASEEPMEPQDLTEQQVTTEPSRGSSGPAPGTSAFPPPGPRP
jgi:hypothetical protein